MKFMILFLVLAVSGILQSPEDIYELTMTSIDGEEIDFERYRDQTLLIVNVASECGNTPQYEELQRLHENFGDQVTVLGFPANNFGGQEPGSNDEIAQFCKQNYGVSFQMFAKISVKGEDQHPLYAWLKEKTGKEPTWNFCKYMVKPDGTVIFYGDKVNPLDAKIVDEL